MTEYQRRALDMLINIHQPDPAKLALIITGSIAAGRGRDGSDIDLYLVVTDDEFRKVQEQRRYFYGCWDPREFSGVGIDGKIISKKFLQEAVNRGSEPTRASFLNAYAAFSKDPEIMVLVQQIPVYPQREHAARCRAFFGMMKHHRYEGEPAFRNGNHYYFQSSVHGLVFFAARLVLAHNRILYPCRKSLFHVLEQAADQPADFRARSENLLQCTALEPFLDYYDSITRRYVDYDSPDDERIGLLLENELNWFTGAPAFDEW